VDRDDELLKSLRDMQRTLDEIKTRLDFFVGTIVFVVVAGIVGLILEHWLG
jgi:hypothetical protein